ncbi:titin homolog isoform X2 [Bradysia coprophila]|uniref:titin homolog isoform X2 n=1 Tax=Bradysia coprophila TaxID=38358 RepID=UPI00187D8BCB|nr:titin homolog isoform X2 [Bradysia coprophila]
MAEETSYHDGDIVWVKMNKLWWPGEVHGTNRLPSDFMDQFKKPPLFVIKFFQEENYHCVNQSHQIARYNCAKKNEFIKKGLDLYYAKHSYMAEFPADVAIAEKRTGGNPNIIHSKEFMPVVKADKATPVATAKGSTSRSRRGQQQIQTSAPSIPRVMFKPDHDTRILMPSSPATFASSPSSAPTTPTAADNKYKCNSCNFSTNRINTLIWHQKTHSSPKTPQMSTTPKYPTKHTPSTTTSDETNSSSSTKVPLETEAISKDCAQSKPPSEIAEPEDASPEPVESMPEPVMLPAKPKGKRGRSAKEPKAADKTPKTDNKLRNILDDWSDDEMAEAGPSGLTSSHKMVKGTVKDEDVEDEIKQENKRSKLDNEMLSKSNRTEVVNAVAEYDDQNSEIVSSIASEDDDKSKLGKTNGKGETVTPSSIRRRTNDVTDDDTKPQTRSLRSGKTTLASESSPLLPKRRGRAKRSANDSLKSESATLEVKESEAEPVVPEQRETDNAQTSSSDKISDASVEPAPVQVSAPNKSHSKTSRKGKPRRKEEIKLSNNISVAVLVEKTNLSPPTDFGIEQKLDTRAEDNDYANVVHKKIRYMSRNSTDGHRKSIELLEVPKLPALASESKEIEGNDRMIEELDNNQDADTTKESIHGNDLSEEKIVESKSNDVSATSEDPNLSGTSSLNPEKTEEGEKVTENSIVTEARQEQRVVPKCYERKVSPKKNLPTDRTDSRTTSPLSFADGTNEDTYELPSSSNLRQRSPRRYENMRNRRKSDRRTVSNDDLTSIIKAIDDKCDGSDSARRKSIGLNNSLDEDTGKLSETINGKGDVTENSDSKTSTPEKADSSKELDCFDFTEDECLKPPEVLNRRKRLPPAKVFELDNIDKIEEQRKIDEESARVTQQREEENQKLHAELENLLNSTTPATLPEIPVGPKVHENFPERRAEKDPEKIVAKDGDDKDRMLPPKERNKRIFKYRNRNRRPEFDMKVGCSVEEAKGNDANGSMQQSDDVSDTNVATSGDKLEQESKLKEHVPENDTGKDTPSAHDLKIEIAETLINFPLLSPHTDVSEEPVKKVVATKQPAIKRKESAKTTRNAKKSRTTAPVESTPKIEPDVKQEQTTEIVQLLDSATKGHSFIDGKKHSSEAIVLSPNQDGTVTNLPSNSTGKKIMEKQTANPAMNAAPSSSVRDFSRIRLIEKIENRALIQPTDEAQPSKGNQLPLKKTIVLTQTEGNSFVTQLPKKRKSQTDDDVPAFVIERPDVASEPNSGPSSVKKEPKSFIVTKAVKKHITGDLTRQNTTNTGGLHTSHDVSESIHSQQDTKSNATTSIDTSVQAVSFEAAERISMETPVIVAGQFVMPPATTNTQQNRTITTSTVTSSLLGSLSANRPCTIAPAKRPSYRKPADMTGVTQKQIGVDVKGNPIVVYSKIESIGTHASPPTMAQATLTVQRNDPNPSTSQVVQSFTGSLPSNQVAPAGNKPTTNRRSVGVGNKTKVPDKSAAKPSNDTTATLKKRIVRRISKNQPSTAAAQHVQSNQQQHQQVILNSEINYIGNAPVPPLIPINDQSATSRQQSTKQRSTQMTVVAEPQSKIIHTEVVEQQQDNILALPGDTPGFGGPTGSYFLCKLNEMGMYVPIDRQPLYLDVTDNTNLLKPNAPDAVTQIQTVTLDETELGQQSPGLNEVERVIATNQSALVDQDVNSPKYLINISDGQQLLVDQQGLMALTNGEEFPQFVTPDGQQIILQSGQNDILSAIAFAEDVGLIAGQQILIPEDDLAVIQGQGGNHDILAAALAGTEGFSQEQFIDNVLATNGVEDIVVDPMVYHAMTQPNIPPLTNAVTNETNAVLTQPPIMSTLEQPTKTDRISPSHSLELCGHNLDESLAVIGVTSNNTNVPTSLELPITITNPAIAPKSTTATMSAIYPPSVAAEHDLDYDIFSSSSPITHHLTQPLAINENYRTVNVINSIGDIDLDSNIVAVAASNDQFTKRN